MAKKVKKSENKDLDSVSSVIQFAVVFIMLAAFGLIAFAAMSYK